MPRIGTIREVQEHEFGWRALEPWELGYEHPQHRCDDHCVASDRVNGAGKRETFLFHPWRS